ncbi:MAG: helix-turn-helix domain-containing protein [Candidatus Margulisbacteria bacterium]|jgi:cytoskeletal protein RodZ|nr:helix-turn-helix domain-containing protein [Candidatus Margulisiibacteriota bacterium]
MSDEQELNTPENSPAEPTIGQRLRAARLGKALSLEEIAEQSKIKKTFLEFMENDDFAKMPNLITAKGFLKVYANLLGLNSEEIHKQFIELFPSEAGYRPGREIKVGLAVDKRTLFPTGMRTMNSPGLSHFRTSHKNKKGNKLFAHITLGLIIIALALTASTLYFKNSMVDIKNINLRQKNDVNPLEAKDTPETRQQKIYDQNKVYIEATALSDTYVTIITVTDGRTLPQGFSMRRGDYKAWDGNQYLRIRASVPRSLRLTVNGKDEGILNEPEKVFFPPSAAPAENAARSKTTPGADAAPSVQTGNQPQTPANNNSGAASILNNI